MISYRTKSIALSPTRLSVESQRRNQHNEIVQEESPLTKRRKIENVQTPISVKRNANSSASNREQVEANINSSNRKEEITTSNNITKKRDVKTSSTKAVVSSSSSSTVAESHGKDKIGSSYQPKASNDLDEQNNRLLLMKKVYLGYEIPVSTSFKLPEQSELTSEDAFKSHVNTLVTCRDNDVGLRMLQFALMHKWTVDALRNSGLSIDQAENALKESVKSKSGLNYSLWLSRGRKLIPIIVHMGITDFKDIQFPLGRFYKMTDENWNELKTMFDVWKIEKVGPFAISPVSMHRVLTGKPVDKGLIRAFIRHLISHKPAHEIAIVASFDIGLKLNRPLILENNVKGCSGNNFFDANLILLPLMIQNQFVLVTIQNLMINIRKKGTSIITVLDAMRSKERFDFIVLTVKEIISTIIEDWNYANIGEESLAVHWDTVDFDNPNVQADENPHDSGIIILSWMQFIFNKIIEDPQLKIESIVEIIPSISAVEQRRNFWGVFIDALKFE